jgi:hypothetical protein
VRFEGICAIDRDLRLGAFDEPAEGLGGGGVFAYDFRRRGRAMAGRFSAGDNEIDKERGRFEGRRICFVALGSFAQGLDEEIAVIWRASACRDEVTEAVGLAERTKGGTAKQPLFLRPMFG